MSVLVSSSTARESMLVQWIRRSSVTQVGFNSSGIKYFLSRLKNRSRCKIWFILRFYEKVELSERSVPLHSTPTLVLIGSDFYLDSKLWQVRRRQRHDRLAQVHGGPEARLAGKRPDDGRREDRRRDQPPGGALHLQAEVQGHAGRSRKVPGKNY